MPGVVVLICNPSHLGSQGRRIMNGFEANLRNIAKPYLKIK
jgi:hypothetical protein